MACGWRPAGRAAPGPAPRTGGMFQRTDFGEGVSFAQHLHRLHKVPDVPILVIDPAPANRRLIAECLAQLPDVQTLAAGDTIPQANARPEPVEIEGEASFRQREADVIRDLTAQQGIVLATGGGAVLNEQSRRYLHERGTVVYLRASVNSILQRTSHDRNRPLLQTADPRARIEELSRQRAPLYEEVAHVTIETGRPNVQSVVQNILVHLERREAAEPSSSPALPESPAPTEPPTPQHP